MANKTIGWQTAMAKLRDTEHTLTAAVAAAVNELHLDDADKAAVELAKHYAAAIDAGHCSTCDTDTSLDTLGPKLLAALEALGATPAARSKLRKGGQPSDSPNRLSALRAARSG